MLRKQKYQKASEYTLTETNMAPENGWLEYYILSSWDDLFSGAMLVSGSVIIQTKRSENLITDITAETNMIYTVSHRHLCRIRLTSLHIWQYVCHSLCLHSLLFAHIFLDPKCIEMFSRSSAD